MRDVIEEFGSRRSGLTWKASVSGRARLSGVAWVSLAVAAGGQTVSSPIQTTEQSSSIHGLIRNAATNRPLARALVQVEGRSLLTGPDGRYEFRGLNGTATTVRVSKPGFYEGFDPYGAATKSAPVGSPEDVELRLYPEALLTGTLSAADGEPLTQVNVQALRRVEDESGSRWSMAGQVNTNADGQFRLPLPGGEYVVQTQFVAERFGVHGAILPVMVPASGTTAGGGANTVASTLQLLSGSEQHLDLHPPVRSSHAVHIQVDSTASRTDGAPGPQIRVHLANGIIFQPQARPGEKSGETVLNLPNGNYLLSASTGTRGDAASYGETRVTVADEDVTGVLIHLQKAMDLTIETAIDPAATETGGTAGAAPVDPGSPAFAQKLGIYLQRTDAGVSLRNENVSPTPRPDGTVEFTLEPGSYRLKSAGYGPWFIESANAGGTDLLTQVLVVDGGSSSQPLRLVVSNLAASVKGTTRISGAGAPCSVYLIANAPSATPVIIAKSGGDGSFTRSSLPPGSYRVVATEDKINFDLTRAGVQRQLAPYMKTVTIGASETAGVELDAVPASELKP